MWLERFSGHSPQSSSSPTPNRTISPAPRRSTQVAPNAIPRRPGLNPRTSSLSIVSLGGSTDSLPQAAKVPQGSSLRKELVTASTDAPDPVDVLEGILGPVQGHDGTKYDSSRGGVGKPTDLVEDIDFEGLSLDDFAINVLKGSDVSVQDGPVIEDFEKETDKFEDLHKSIVACDEVLRSVETYLTSFRADLAHVSAEIETLQDRSIALNKKLNNRKSVEKVLGPEVEALTVPPTVVRKIVEGPMDETWVKALDELEKRSKTIDVKLQEGKDIAAATDLRPLLDALSTKAVQRTRDHIVSQIKALRSPSINAQTLQQQKFLPLKPAFAFLARRQPQLAAEITQAYVYTMRWYYLSHFTRYKASLEKMPLHTIDSSALLASEPQTISRGAKPSTADPFSLGRRAGILKSTQTDSLPSHAADETNTPQHLELPFHSFNLALLDNATAEYSFLTNFLPSPIAPPLPNPTATLTTILNPTFTLGQSLTRTLTSPPTTDALGLLLSIRLTHALAFASQRARLPPFEPYTNATAMLLWPRFQQTLDAHTDSLRRATASLPGRPAASSTLSLSGAASNLVGGGSSSASTSDQQGTAPHPLTNRVAHLLSSLVALSKEAGDDEPISPSLGRLRTEFDAFLAKASRGLPERGGKPQRFLRNNYELVEMVLREVAGEGRLGKECEEWVRARVEAVGGGG